MRRWGPIVAAIVGIAFLGALLLTVRDDRGWDGRNRGDDSEVTRIVGANGQETIVIHDNDRGHFFPLGILFVPLFFLFFFGVMRAIFGRGRFHGPWGGPGGPGMGYGYGPPWLDEWHRRAHGDAPRAPSEGSAPTAPPTQGGVS